MQTLFLWFDLVAFVLSLHFCSAVVVCSSGCLEFILVGSIDVLIRLTLVCAYFLARMNKSNDTFFEAMGHAGFATVLWQLLLGCTSTILLIYKLV